MQDVFFDLFVWMAKFVGCYAVFLCVVYLLYLRGRRAPKPKPRRRSSAFAHGAFAQVDEGAGPSSADEPTETVGDRPEALAKS
jgi:hypothetical protein